MQKLVPFSPFKSEVKGDLIFTYPNLLTVEFEWHISQSIQNLENLPSKPGQRLNELWKTTCFEAFLKPLKQPLYWEINFSLNGDWNAYKFQYYREPSPPQEDPDFKCVGFDARENLLRATFKHGFFKGTKMQAGLSCILDIEKEKSYWALKHAPGKPDFHVDTSFIFERTSK